MDGGGGLGLFTGTAGARGGTGGGTDAFSGGTLVAAATSAGTATDAGSNSAKTSKASSSSIFEQMRPWWSYPYGHPEKTRGIEQLQEVLKTPLEDFARGFLYVDRIDPKSNIITKGSKFLGRKLKKKHE